MSSLIPLLSGAISLVAFVVWAAVLAYREALRRQERQIALARPQDRAALVAAALEAIQVDTRKLTPEDQAKLAHDVLQKKLDRYKIAAGVVVTIAVLSAGVLALALIMGRTPAENSTTRPPASETKIAKRDKAAIGFILIKRGAEPEFLGQLRPEESGNVTDTRDPGWSDHYVTETFLEFPLTEGLRKAEHVDLRFDISRTSNATYAGNVGHYAGTGTVDIRRFGASSPLARIELTKNSFEINITQLVKQYSTEKVGFIGFRFYNPEAAREQTKQFHVVGGRLEAR